MDRPAKKHIVRTALGTLAIVVGLLCLMAAVAFGMAQTVRLSKPETEAPNTTAAGAACGLAIAGGLCFVAAAIAEAGAVWLRPPSESSNGPV
jgi:hypothetical protein